MKHDADSKVIESETLSQRGLLDLNGLAGIDYQEFFSPDLILS